MLLRDDDCGPADAAEQPGPGQSFALPGAHSHRPGGQRRETHSRHCVAVRGFSGIVHPRERNALIASASARGWLSCG